MYKIEHKTNIRNQQNFNTDFVNLQLLIDNKTGPTIFANFKAIRQEFYKTTSPTDDNNFSKIVTL